MCSENLNTYGFFFLYSQLNKNKLVTPEGWERGESRELAGSPALVILPYLSWLF